MPLGRRPKMCKDRCKYRPIRCLSSPEELDNFKNGVSDKVLSWSHWDRGHGESTLLLLCFASHEDFETIKRQRQI